MSVPALLEDLRRRDIRIWADGDRLHCNAPSGVLTAELRDLLQERKNEILAFLRSAGTLAREPRAIVPLQPRGEHPPIFGVAGHNGDVFCYRALAGHLGDDQPFYGLQPPGLDGRAEPLTRIEDLAAYFADQIRAFRAVGPLVITGFCAGGMTAFELARRLQDDGMEVGFVALFGAPHPIAYRRLWQLREGLRYKMRRVVTHGRALAARSFAERRAYVADRLRERREKRAARAAETPDAALRLRAEVERATLAAARRYTPSYFRGRVALFLPCAEWVRSENEGLRWRSSAERVEEYFGPQACTNDNMLREPYAPAFAELFKQCRAVRSQTCATEPVA